MPRRKIRPNPKLEVLREEGLKENRVEYDLEEIGEKCRRVHAGWLFDYKYQVLLQKLCRLLDGNYDTFNTPGWGAFGSGLGLKSEILNVIQCSKLGNEGYTYYVLQHYIQKDNATVNKVIHSLQDIKRFDVINETHEHFSNLAEYVLAREPQLEAERAPSSQQSEDESGYYSVSSDCGESKREVFPDTVPILENNAAANILKPDFIPTPAFVLRDLEKQVQIAAVSSVHLHPRLEHERAVQNAIATSVHVDESRHKENNLHTGQEKKVAQKYDCKVMLTFADDGIKFANEVATMLRKEKEHGYQIGVLVLNEHLDIVESNPELFIQGSFPQVDYVVPVITEGYLKAAMELKHHPHSGSSYIDCKYVRFIYTLMNKDYVRRGCLNMKVRCVIPDDMLHLVHKTVMREPIFENWVKSSSTHKLADRMLARCIRKRSNRIYHD